MNLNREQYLNMENAPFSCENNYCKQKMEAKRWCFTINNPNDEDIMMLLGTDSDGAQACYAEIEYLVMQEERGHGEETTHWQGFLILKKKHRLPWLKRMINARAHFEVARGTPQQCRDYCTKEDTRVPGGVFKEFGRLPERKAVKKKDERFQDACEVLDTIKNTFRPLKELEAKALLQPCFVSAYKELTADILGPYRPKLSIITLIGPPGTGKSWIINFVWPEHGRCIMGNNGVWFQNPLAKVMVFEEFCGQIQLQRMLQFLDPYPLALEVKGGMRPALYETVIITSNTTPDKWYKGDEAGTPGKRTDALLALYDRIGYTGGGYVPVRTCGHYLQVPDGLTIEEARAWFESEIEVLFPEDVINAHVDDLDPQGYSSCPPTQPLD